MRIDWIEDIIALLDTGGVVGAARRRNLTQPAFSRRLQALEDVLGIDLVNRASRPSGPSAVLRDHEDRFRRLADEQRNLISSLRQTGLQGSSQIVIACQHAITTSLGPRIVAVMREAANGSVRLRSANRDECDTMLLSRNASISVTYRIAGEQSDTLPEFLLETTLTDEQLIPVVGARHAKRLMWEFHNGRLTIVGYPSDVFLGIAMSRYILSNLSHRCDTTIAAETALTPAATQMALAGIGIAWVPRALVQAALDEGACVDLGHELGQISMRIVAQRWSGQKDAGILKAWTALCEMCPPETRAPLAATS